MNVLGKITDAFGGTVLKGATDLIDQLTFSKEEKEAAKNKLQEIVNQATAQAADAANKELEIITKDVQSARDRDTQANNSANASWLSKNITPVLALSTSILTFGIFFYVFLVRIDPTNKDIVIYVLGALTAIMGQTFSYYFGSNKNISAEQKSKLHI